MKLFNKEFWILFLTVLLSVFADPAFSADATQKSIMSVCQISDKSIEKTVHGLEFEEHHPGSSKHCEIVETPGIPNPVHQIKDKYLSRHKLQSALYSKRKNSLQNLNNRIISSTDNISPLLSILQI